MYVVLEHYGYVEIEGSQLTPCMHHYGYVEIEGSQLTPCMHHYGAELRLHAIIRGPANEVMSACTSVLSLMVQLNVASTPVRWCS